MQIITCMIDVEPMMSSALSSARAPDACLLFYIPHCLGLLVLSVLPSYA